MNVLKGFDPIKDIPNGVCLPGFFSNYPSQQIIDVIFDFLNQKGLAPVSGQIFLTSIPIGLSIGCRQVLCRSDILMVIITLPAID